MGGGLLAVSEIQFYTLRYQLNSLQSQGFCFHYWVAVWLSVTVSNLILPETEASMVGSTENAN